MTKKIIFFDADDTLWENEGYFRNAEKEFAELLHREADAATIQQTLWARQEGNIPIFGYGSKTYMLGMLDTAIELCGGSLSSEMYFGIKKIVTDLAYHRFEMIDGVESVLGEVRDMGYELAVATKGDLTEQLTKYRQSGLSKFFHHIEVLEEKDRRNYLELCQKFDMAPEALIMVGNSVKSDIAPVIEVGGRAIHVPHGTVWVHEVAEMPDSDRVFEAGSIADVPEILRKMKYSARFAGFGTNLAKE